MNELSIRTEEHVDRGCRKWRITWVKTRWKYCRWRLDVVEVAEMLINGICGDLCVCMCTCVCDWLLEWKHGADEQIRGWMWWEGLIRFWGLACVAKLACMGCCVCRMCVWIQWHVVKMEWGYKPGGCDCWRVLIYVAKLGRQQGASKGGIKRAGLGWQDEVREKTWKSGVSHRGLVFSCIVFLKMITFVA